MSRLEIVITQMITQALAENRILPKMPGYRMAGIVTVISMVSAIAGLLFCLLALYHWLESMYSFEKTMLGMAAAMFALSLCGGLICASKSYCRRRLIKRQGKKAIRAVAELYKDIAGEFEFPLKNHQGMSLIAALVAGLLIGKILK